MKGGVERQRSLTRNIACGERAHAAGGDAHAQRRGEAPPQRERTQNATTSTTARPTRRHGAPACWERTRIAGEQRPRVRAEAARASKGYVCAPRGRVPPSSRRCDIPPPRAQSLVLRGSRRGRHRRRPVHAVARARALDVPPCRQSKRRRGRRSRAEWRWGGRARAAARRVARSAERGRRGGGSARMPCVTSFRRARTPGRRHQSTPEAARQSKVFGRLLRAFARAGQPRRARARATAPTPTNRVLRARAGWRLVVSKFWSVVWCDLNKWLARATSLAFVVGPEGARALWQYAFVLTWARGRGGGRLQFARKNA